MNSTKLWLDRAEDLRLRLTSLRSAQLDEAVSFPREEEEQERVVIARWLRQEFSDEPPEDDATLPLSL